ncbi:cellulose biosynthesis cyclic di-GMP-binding regulatory protein BcsB [Allocoleopsis sp.]|uniref:cellulose biosynthesis cyclic di-GMP-binding regulatory protein BcsB n=1 Tax=Allocoleopsis sp. TaxID=3088169 RepID=UPI002FD642BD
MALAQSDEPAAPNASPSTETLRENNINESKERSPNGFPLANPPVKGEEVAAPPSGDPYVLEFNRSPVVGTRFSLRGIYDESRLGFTRPRDWKIKSIKAQIRYRHSPALYATRSNLTVLLNGASIGSIPLNRKDGEIGNAVFNVPLSLLQNYNELTIGALQNNSPTCTQDPFDPSLWTEILPDSKIVFDFTPQAASLDFNRFPYPIFDELSLFPNQIAYLLPSKVDDTWLTSTSRFQATLGRLADYRRMDTRLVKTLDEVGKNVPRTAPAERLIIIGTPEQQPILKSLNLSVSLKDNQLLDDKKKAFPPDVGVLMLTTTPDKKAPVLVATGNGPVGVAKAVQFLVQAKDRQIGTGQSIIVKNLTLVPTPNVRDWPGYLPNTDTFKLSDLKSRDNKPLQDVTVRGSDSPPIVFDFRALPDDQFGQGNTMTLKYSYGPQINAKTSLVEVKLDGVSLIGKRLTSIDGKNRETLRVALPGDLIKPTSKIQVDFRLDARERRSCSRVTDQQLWGTLHADTSFEVKRNNAVQLPDLERLRYGFPFAAPQDLSSTAIVVPKEPSPNELATLLEFSTRLGRLSKAKSVQLDAYTINSIPKELLKKRQLVGIGTQKTFPFPEVLKSGDFQLKDQLERQRVKSEVTTLPDSSGVIKEIISPYANDKVLLALTAQTENGLKQVQDFLRQDPLFFQLKEDTALISANTANPESYDPNAYNLEFLQREPKRTVDKTPVQRQVFRFVTGSWFMLGPAMVAATLILYGVVQQYLKKIAGQEK